MDLRKIFLFKKIGRFKENIFITLKIYFVA